MANIFGHFTSQFQTARFWDIRKLSSNLIVVRTMLDNHFHGYSSLELSRIRFSLARPSTGHDSIGPRKIYNICFLVI